RYAPTPGWRPSRLHRPWAGAPSDAPTAAAPPRQQDGIAVWLLPAGLVVVTALIIGHAARKPPQPANPARRGRRKPPAKPAY
ncbi:hypothetical protein, partial [Actinoplanes xinjiangensis]|uniref:hypothetical protein n=1 Tax=Actinoplanes xinjiangensis TaxID=512350 RepID=UPI00341C1A99